MSFKLRKPNLSSGIAVAAVGAALVVGSTGGAYASHLIHTRDIAPGAVSWTKLDTLVQNKINRPGPQGKPGKPGKPGKDGVDGTDGVNGADGVDGKDGMALAGSVIPASPVTIAHIGDGFAANATQVGTMHLDAGTYLINGDGYFALNTAGQADAAVSGVHTHLELAIRGPVSESNTWGDDFGGCFTGAYAVPSIEATCSTTRLITLAAPTDLSVKVFGYNEEKGNVGSGDFDVTVNVSALKVTVPATN